MATAFADNLAKIVLRIAMLGNQLLVAQRFFEWIKIGTLYVLDNREFKRRTIIDVPDDNRNFSKASELRCAPATFAGNNFKAVLLDCAHHDRLHDPVLPNGGCEILEFAFIKMTTRIAWAARDKLDRHRSVGADCPLRLAHRQGLIHLADQGCKTATKAALGEIITHTILHINLAVQ